MSHFLRIKETFAQLKTSDSGIEEAEAKKRLLQYGRNVLKEEGKKSLLTQFLEEFKDLMVIILLAATLIAWFSGEKVDASVIFFIVMLNAVIGFIQKYKAEKALEALKKMVSPTARVIRGGKEMKINAEWLVPGDIVLLAEGDKITADMRLIKTSELRISEAVLTGESSPILKDAESIHEKDEHIAEIRNMAFMGTSVVSGTGVAVVVSTGMSTEFGKIAKLTTSTQKDKSPLQKEVMRIGIFVGKITLVLSTALFLVGYFWHKESFIESFLFSVSVAVAAVPEGLPATITIALAIGVQRLARKNAIVKQLASVETLGSTTVICSDKTGTLTKNEMTVEEMHFDEYNAKITGVGYSPEGDIHFRAKNDLVSIINAKGYKITMKDVESTHPKLYEMAMLFLKASALCNNAKLIKEKDSWNMLGDPTEGALLTLSSKAGVFKENLEKNSKRLFELPFESMRKRMSVIYKEKHGNKTTYACYTKGAPETTLTCCTHIMDDGKVRKITKKDIDHFTELNEDMARRALRVIAFAYKEITEKEASQKRHEPHELESKLVFIGLTGMIDPPREEVKEAVEMTHRAGIKIYVVTGDHGLMAEAISRQLEIVKGKNVRIITGKILEKLSVQKLKAEFKKYEYIIFARVSPSHKLKVVETLKSLGEVVAVTGDGVNDAPALKRADIGVAMGITGTDVSKEAANMVLADDKFSTIINAIREGRTIYGNLKKFVHYIFSCNIGELFTVFAAIILGLPAPVTATLILAVDLGTDVLPALAIGVEPSEKDVMDRPPRNPKDKIMKRGFIARYLYIGTFIGLITTSVFLYQLYSYGWTWGQHLEKDSLIYIKGTSAALAVLILIQMINAFNARSENKSIFSVGITKNLWLIGAVTISILTMIAYTEVPFVQQFLHTTHLTPSEWGLVIGASFLILFIEEARKLIVKIT